ncbi:MAG: putative permease [Myxococcaceae bacterium]|nr:putative permease [Myxococcaceae bacterium]
MHGSALLICAGMLSGAMNAAAGGGSFVSLPALVFAGVPVLSANASSTVALFPGALASAYAYRGDMRPLAGTSLRALVVSSVSGGFLGALLLLFTPQREFERVLPWLLLIATVTFATAGQIARALVERVKVSPTAVVLTQFLLGVYGGYFGGAVGLMMMALWSVYGATDIRAMNATKALLGGTMNAVAGLCFIFAGKVWWTQTLLVLAGALAGGYFGARFVRRIPPAWLRAGITIFNVVMTALFFLRSR